MRNFGLLTLIAGFIFLGAGCTGATSTEQEANSSFDGVMEYSDETEEIIIPEEDEEKINKTIYEGERIITGYLTPGYEMSGYAFDLTMEEAQKLPEATGGDYEYYGVMSMPDDFERPDEIDFVIYGTFRVGETRVWGPNIYNMMMWDIEVLKIISRTEVTEKVEQ